MKRSIKEPLRILRLGRGVLNCVAWSPDRYWLAVGGDDGVVYVFTPKGVPCWRGKGHRAPIESLAWSPNGHFLASGSDDHTLRLWSRDGDELRCVTGHEDVVASIAWSPDSRCLVSGASDHTLRLWSVADGSELQRISGHEGAIWSVAWSPDGRYLASGSSDRSVRLWSATSGVEVRLLAGHIQQVTHVAWSPDSRRLASSARDYTVRVWSVQDGVELRRNEGREDAILSIAWSPDGQYLALGSSRGFVRLWSFNDEHVDTLKVHGEQVWGVAWSVEGSHLAALARDGTLTLWEIARPITNKFIKSTPTLDATAQWIARQAATVGRRAARWLPQLPETDGTGIGMLRPTQVTQRSGAPCISLSPDGRRLASGHVGGRLYCWNLLDGGLLWVSKEAKTACERIIQDLAWSPNGEHLAVGAEDGTISLWSAADGTELHHFMGHQAPISSLAWSPDSSRLVSGAADYTVRLWLAEDGVELACLRGHTDIVRDVAWSPDGHHLASGGQDHTVRLWSAIEGKELHCLKGHTDFVYCIAWSADGLRLASGARDGTVRLWSVVDGREQSCLNAHPSAVLSVAWSQEGDYLASGSMDGALCVWNPSNTEAATQLKPRCLNSPGYVWRLTWALNTAFLVSSHEEDTIRFWDTRNIFPFSGQPPAVDSSALPTALIALHRVGIYPPLSLVHDLNALLGGKCPPTLDALISVPGGEKIHDLQALRWSNRARIGLIALLLRDLPNTDWEPPAKLTPNDLSAFLTVTLQGELITPDGPPPPLAFLSQVIAGLDAASVTLIASLGPRALITDPGILSRVSHCIAKLPNLNRLQRRLLRHHLKLPQVAHETTSLAKKRTIPLPNARNCPVVVVLDCPSDCHGASEVAIRIAAHALAVHLSRCHLTMILVVAGTQPTVHLLKRSTDLLLLLTQYNSARSDPIATLTVATTLRHKLMNSHATSEPIIFLLTQPQWGAEVVDMVTPFPHLRALFVQDATLEHKIAPAWTKHCECWEIMDSDQYAHLPEILGRLVGKL